MMGDNHQPNNKSYHHHANIAYPPSFSNLTANLQQQPAAYYTAHSPSSIYHYNYPQPAQHHYQQLQASHIGLYHHHQQQPPQNYHAGHFQKQHQQQLPAFNGGSSIPMVKDSGLIGGLVGSNSSSSLSDPSSPASSSSYQPTYTTVMNSSSSTHDPNAAALAQNKEWFDYLLQMAHQKYNTQDYSSALSILQSLYNLNQSHLPTLLLLGCTSYSLGFHHHSIFYNNAILSIDPQFAEAYSNLGTTHRSMAAAAAAATTATLSATNNHQENNNNFNPLSYMLGSSSSSSFPPPPPPNLPILSPPLPALIGKSNIECAEYYYRTAVSIRPKYWDANINLAGLLSSQGRWREAIDVYEKIEALMEESLSPNERLAYVPAPSSLSSSSNDDGGIFGEVECIRSIAATERLRSAKLQLLAHATSPIATATDPNLFSVERRRDLYFAKGNLFYAIGSIESAKMEYFKGLVVVGLDISFAYNQSTSTVNSSNMLLPVSTLTPQQALQIHQQKQGKPPSSNPIHHPTTSSILQTLAKMYQDANRISLALSYYYISLSIFPTANTCNNLGILLAGQRLAESIHWYEFGLILDPGHVHLYTNLGSALKDSGKVNEGIYCYQRAISLQPDFFIALANLANVYKDQGRVEEAIELYRRGLRVKPDFVEAFCNYANSLLFICDWTDRDTNLEQIKQIVRKQLNEGALTLPKTVPTVLPFHTFTYSSLDSWMVREISRRNADRVTWNVVTSDWFVGFPQRPRTLMRKIKSRAAAAALGISGGVGCQQSSTSPLSTAPPLSLSYPYPYPIPPIPAPYIKVGYVSSDFNNHPLAHLMQSVFGMHDRSRFKVYCYSLSPTDHSPYRLKIEKESDVFIDISNWSIKDIVERISLVDQIHILCNLNGYTKGGRNEIFAARPCPIQMAFMGYAGTMGAGPINDSEINLGDGKEMTVGGGGGLVTADTTTAASMTTSSSPGDHELDGVASRWIDYIVVDEIVCPKKLVCGEPLTMEEVERENNRLATTNTTSHLLPMGSAGPIYADNDKSRIYTEGVIYMPQSYFVNDHRQGFRDVEDIEADRITRMGFSNNDAGGVGGGMDMAPEDVDPEESGLTLDEVFRWRKEEIRRLRMRREVFPMIKEDTVIFANFNQLYKIDPYIFASWMNILKMVPNSILWLLRFPPAGEPHLRKMAENLVGEEVSNRLYFTDVAAKHVHIHRGRVADIFLDTPECNAHTTAADILWTGTPVITYPKYEFKMCSRVAASVAYATGSWSETDTPYYIVDADRNLNKHGQPVHRYPGLVLSIDRLSDPNLLGHDMVVNSYQEYEARAIELSLGMKWSWKRIAPVSSCLSPPPPPPPLHPSSLSSILNMDLGNPLGGSFYPDSANPKYILVPHGRLAALRRRLFLTRDSSSLFDTQTWVRNLESGMMMAYKKFQTDWAFIQERNMREMQGVDDDEESSHEPASSMMSKPSRCLKIIIH